MKPLKAEKLRHCVVVSAGPKSAAANGELRGILLHCLLSSVPEGHRISIKAAS